MQRVIDVEFKHVTVVSVLHRFTFIERFDRVAVLQQGRLMECDSPRALLGRDSVFRGLYHAHRERSWTSQKRVGMGVRPIVLGSDSDA